MPKLDEYCHRLGQVLRDRFGLSPHTPPPRPISLRQFSTTIPNYVDGLCRTFNLSRRAAFEDVYRIGYGNKLTCDDSEWLMEVAGSLSGAVVDERGILCPSGIFVFYHDVLSPRRQDVQLLAASYHFQTGVQAGGTPLYVRFEFDPAGPRDAAGGFRTKPVFHYHFSNYNVFPEGCHFPGGVFDVPDCGPICDENVNQHLQSATTIDLDRFLSILIEAGLIEA